MPKLLRRVADLALVHPKMMCAEAADEIVVERNFVFQILDALPQFILVAGEKNCIYKAEINLCYLVAIGAKERFKCYVHSLYLIKVLISKRKLR